MATLVIVDGPSEGLKFSLGEHNIVMIGRDAGATLQILDGRLSRFHLQIRADLDAGTHFAIDFDSANGVYVNERQIERETLLADGDVIRAGDSSILYTTTDEPDARRVSQLMRQYGQARHQTQLDTSNQRPD